MSRYRSPLRPAMVRVKAIKLGTIGSPHGPIHVDPDNKKKEYNSPTVPEEAAKILYAKGLAEPFDDKKTAPAVEKPLAPVKKTVAPTPPAKRGGRPSNAEKARLAAEKKDAAAAKKAEDDKKAADQEAADREEAARAEAEREAADQGKGDSEGSDQGSDERGSETGDDSEDAPPAA